MKEDNFLVTFTLLPCPFLAKPHPCLLYLFLAELGQKYNK